MVKKIPIVDVNVTSSISGAVQPLSPMFGRGLVSTDSLNSEVNTTQSIFYANSFILSAINIVIPKDFIRAFSDIGILSDRPSIGYSKPLTDSIDSINDNSVLILSKAFSNLINTSDNFNKVIFFIRKPEETITLVDRLSVGYTKPLTDSINSINDNRVFNLSKVFSNLVNTPNDFTIINFTKSPFETVNVLEKPVFNFNKTLSDASVIQDLAAQAISKPFADLFSVNDSDTINFTKVNFETIVTSDRAILNFVKNSSDSITTVDSILRFDFIKFLADTANVEDLTNVFDGSTYTIDKTVTDSAISSENFSKIVIFNRAFQDVQSIIELATINFNKILESTANNNDNLTLNNSLFKTDSIIGIEDVFNKVVGYSRSFTDEQQGQTDSSIFDFGKVLADNNSINDDDILSVTKVLSDISNINEVTIINFDKIRSDQVDTSDLFNRIVSFNLSLTDVALQQDLAALSVTKPLSDVIGHFDGPIQFDLIKPFDDAVQQPEDSDVFDLNKALTDFNNQSDSNTIDFTKVLADNATPLDNIDVFDGSTHSLAKVVADIALPIESNVIEFAKVLADSVNLTENGKVANQNYIADYFAEDYIGESRLIA